MRCATPPRQTGVALQEYIIRERSQMQASLEQAIGLSQRAQASLEQAITQAQRALAGWEKAADLLEEHGILRPLPAARPATTPAPRMPKPWKLGPAELGWVGAVCIFAAVGLLLGQALG